MSSSNRAELFEYFLYLLALVFLAMSCFFPMLAVSGRFFPLPLIKGDRAVLVSKSERSQNG